MSNFIVIKNLAVICGGFLLIFTAFSALTNLQSTMNGDHSVGTCAMVVQNAFFIISSLLLSSVLVKRLGCKNTLILSTLGFVPYVASNFYPKWETLIPTAAICGLAAGPMWAARGTYVSHLSAQYTSRSSNRNHGVIVAMFFGICSVFYQCAQVWGNLISYYVLKPQNSSAVSIYDNVDRYQSVCGPTFCSDSADLSSIPIEALNPPSDRKRFLLSGVYLVCTLLAVLVFWLFLDSSKSEKKQVSNSNLLFSLCFDSLKQSKKLDQILILPLTFYLGISNGFFFSDFTKAYVGCSLGMYHVGLVMMVYGVSSTILSAASGPAVKYFGRCAVFLTSAVVSMLTYVILLVWEVDSSLQSTTLPFFAVATAWGFVDAIWWSQMLAFYSVVFKNDEEAAFSNFYLWNSFGFMVAFALERVICIYMKIYVLMGILIIGMVGFFIADSIFQRKFKNTDICIVKDTESPIIT